MRMSAWIRACGGIGAALLLALALNAPALAAGGVAVEKPWMRFIIKARPAAGYFTLRNDTDAPAQLTGASSSACGAMMLHQSKEENGVEKMLPVKRITVPAHGSVTFQPGGYHLMCMNPRSAMVVGHEIPVILTFADGNTVAASFPVRGPGGR